MSTVETPSVKHNGDALGTGRRKTSVARVRVRAGNGTIVVNGRAFENFFVREQDRNAVLAPLARALKTYDSGLEDALRQAHLLTRDSRMKERKHYGLRGARRGTQFSKR